MTKIMAGFFGASGFDADMDMSAQSALQLDLDDLLSEDPPCPKEELATVLATLLKMDPQDDALRDIVAHVGSGGQVEVLVTDGVAWVELIDRDGAPAA